MIEFEFTLDEINEVAKKVLLANPERVILFNGSTGAGKTTFIKAFAHELGVADATASPTFSLVNEYKTKDGLLYHFDVYRLKNEIEALDMGIDEYLYSGHWCCIEWAEKIPNLIPENHATITISVLPDGKRKLVLQ